MANVPDFFSLSNQQFDANNAATNLTNQANRPNQYNPMGSVTWGQDASGNWTQSNNLSGDAQNLWNQSMGGQNALAGQIGQGLNTWNLPGFANTNLTGNLGAYGSDPRSGLGAFGSTSLNQGLGAFGSDPRAGLNSFGATDLTSNLGAMPQVGQYNQQIIDTMNRLAQPGLNQQAAASRQRLAAQGITNGSSISNQNEGIIGNNWNDAGLKSILAGYAQGNTEYGQALQGRAQRYGENLGQSQNQTAQRAQQYNENLGWGNMQNAERLQGFNENLQMSNKQDAQRQQQFNENNAWSTRQDAQRQQGYTENLGMANLQDSQRQQAFGENESAYKNMLAGNTALQSMRDSLNPNKWSAEFNPSANYAPRNIYGAAQDIFNANTMNENAATASRQANVSGGIDALRAGTSLFAGSGIGGLGPSAASNIWGGISGGASSAWDWAKNMYGNITDPYGYGSWNTGGNQGSESGGSDIP